MLYELSTANSTRTVLASNIKSTMNRLGGSAHGIHLLDAKVVAHRFCITIENPEGP